MVVVLLLTSDGSRHLSLCHQTCGDDELSCLFNRVAYYFSGDFSNANPATIPSSLKLQFVGEFATVDREWSPYFFPDIIAASARCTSSPDKSIVVRAEFVKHRRPHSEDYPGDSSLTCASRHRVLLQDSGMIH